MPRGPWTRPAGVRVQRVLKVQRVQRVVVAPLRTMSMKSALRDLLSVSYDMISILVISRYAAAPYPAAPDFPPSGGQNKALKSSPFISSSQHNGAL